MSARAEIASLIVLYSFLLDDRRYDDWSHLFVEDGELVIGGVVHRGHDALKAAVRRVEPARPGRRFVGPSLIERSGDATAYAWSDMIAVVPDEAGVLRVTATNRYYDELRRIDGRWLFQRRVMQRPGAPLPAGCRAVPDSAAGLGAD